MAEGLPGGAPGGHPARRPSDGPVIRPARSAPRRPRGGRLVVGLGRGLLVAPLLAVIAFVRAYSTAMPLTDEWLFLQAIMARQGTDLLSVPGLASAFQVPRFAMHVVVVPFLVYWPVAEWVHFDSRWFIYLTVAVLAVEALLIRRYLLRSSMWALPLVLLLFSPAHYMEFLWGWQITVALSIAFALGGLVIIDRAPIPGGRGRQAGHLAGGALCFLLATLSTAGGLFGFPSALLLVWLKPFDRRVKGAAMGLLALATAAAYLGVLRDPDPRLTVGWRQAAQVLTALGGTIWGSPVGLFEFGPDLLSGTGLVITVCALAVVARAAATGALPRLALALSVTLFGLLCLASIAMVREYLGNWHLQFALPAVGGTYAAAYLLWREDRSAVAVASLATMLAVLMAGLFGYYRGFAEYGPSYHAYIRSVERYARGHLETPDQPKPFPEAWDTSAQMLLFLSAHGHPLFEDSPPLAPGAPLSGAARIFLDQQEVTPPFSIVVRASRLVVLTVALPGETRARAVLARIGTSTLVLRRIHPRHAATADCGPPGVTCFSGLVVSRMLEPGLQPVHLSLAEE